MNYVHVQTVLGLTNLIDMGKISEFEMISDIRERLPHGVVKFNDQGGKIFAEFDGMAVGSTVDITLMSEPEGDSDEPKEKLEYPTYYVTQVDDDGMDDPGALSGEVAVHFSHPWTIFRDATVHAYKPMNSAELIKKILKDDSRGIPFTVTDKNFSKTDDQGSVSRYKAGETDYEFILNKVLPYCASAQRPVHFFCDDKGVFWLKSFSELYKEKPTLIIAPPPNNTEAASEIDKKVTQHGLKPERVFMRDSAFVRVGGERIIEEMMPSFIAENVNNGTTFGGMKRPGNALSGHSGESFGNFLPIDLSALVRTKGTTSKVVNNRSIVDTTSLFFAGSKIIDEAFCIGFDCDFVGMETKVGDTVDVIFPKIVYPEGDESKEKGNLVSWLSGKWLILRLEHHLDPERPKRILSRIYASRPSFVGHEKTTSINMIKRFFEVIV
jgi:hypothetical protein